RTDGRSIVDAEARRGTQVGEGQVARIGKDVARIEERDPGEALRGIDPQFDIEDDFAVATRWKSGGADRLCSAEAIEREASDRRVTACEEPLARRQVVNGTHDWVAALIDGFNGARKAMCEADPFRGGENDSSPYGQ